MVIHEYQAKKILAGRGAAVPRGGVAETPDQAAEIASWIGRPVVLKAQVHAGGRGRAGGIRAAADPDEARRLAQTLLGTTLVTSQTGPRGKPVGKLLVEETADIDRELYLGLTIDRSREAMVMMASPLGGVEIEAIVSERPELVFREVIDPLIGLAGFQARRLGLALGLSGEPHAQAVRLMSVLSDVFQGFDASLVEINPLALTDRGRLLALDVKMVFDDNALLRHPDILALRDLDQESPLEVRASQNNLSYIKLEGDIGCLVNGAGLAMATMDLIKHSGGRTANFLDVGGGASEESVAEACKILASDSDVKAALINIFGGIVRCDLVAAGVVRAVREVGLAIPLVVRLKGTHVEQGMTILAESGLPFVAADTMREAAEAVVRLAAGRGRRRP